MLSSYPAGFSLIHLACRKNDVELLQSLLSSRVSPDARNRKGRTCLHVCAKYSREECLKLLIEAGADVNSRDSRQLTPLNMACGVVKKQSNCVSILLKAGADPNIPDESGTIPLNRACTLGPNKYVRKLLKYKADPNLADKEGNTSLHVALTECFYIEILEVLLEAGADIYCKNKLGNSPFDIAQSYAYCSELFLSHDKRKSKK